VDLCARGRLLEGEFRPGGRGREWCDPEVLRSLRRRSLARLRKQVEPVEPAALARLLVDWHAVVDQAAAPSPRAPALIAGGPDALLDVIVQIQGAALPATVLETDVLPARLPGYRPQDLDALCAAGEVVWVGLAALGERDGRIALYLASDLPLLHAPAGDPPKGALHEALRGLLASRGASFFADLHAASGGGLAQGVLDALWDLVWSGEVTNDTPGALRAFLASRAARRPGRRRTQAFRSRRELPAAGVGRFSLLAPRLAPAAKPAERAMALCEQLLARHGIVTRDAVAGEGVAGGFAALYPVFAAMEEAGRIRRGYFVAGLGGSQFADPGALERLRVLREGTDDEPRAAVLASTDPANPYGAALAWPEGLQAMRAAQTHVVIAEGTLAAYLARGGSEVRLLLPPDEPQRTRIARATAHALVRWALASGRPTLGWSGEPPLSRGPLAPFLAEAGFRPSGPGVRLERTD